MHGKWNKVCISHQILHKKFDLSCKISINFYSRAPEPKPISSTVAHTRPINYSQKMGGPIMPMDYFAGSQPAHAQWASGRPGLGLGMSNGLHLWCEHKRASRPLLLLAWPLLLNLEKLVQKPAVSVTLDNWVAQCRKDGFSWNQVYSRGSSLAWCFTALYKSRILFKCCRITMHSWAYVFTFSCCFSRPHSHDWGRIRYNETQYGALCKI